MTKTVRSGRLSGSVRVPASKSHTIRAVLIAALAHGESRLSNVLESADARSCLSTAEAFGADVTQDALGEFRIRGVGGAPRAPRKPIDVGNSGTTLYFSASIAALVNRPVTFTGDDQIQNRPAGNLLSALSELGASVDYHGRPGFAPFSIRGPLRGGAVSIECPTSQYLSSLLLACPLAAADTKISVPLLFEQPYVEMTLDWLARRGVHLERRGFEWFRVPGRQRYTAFEAAVPGDFSSATFFLCGAAVTGSSLRLEGLDMGDAQGDKEVVNLLAAMGCRVEVKPDAVVIHGGRLHGRDVDMNAIPDALPALAVAACYAEGPTRLYNVPQARLKETDRIAVMRAELSKMGARVEELPDGLFLHGRPTGSAAPLEASDVDGHQDHRVVMALAVAALGAKGETRIGGAEAAAVTYPEFFEELDRLRGD